MLVVTGEKDNIVPFALANAAYKAEVPPYSACTRCQADSDDVTSTAWPLPSVSALPSRLCPPRVTS